MTSASLHDRVDERSGEFLDWLVEVASIPSISATGEGIADCAAALNARLSSLGVRTEILDTGGAPLVWGSIGSGHPRLVVYGHYDVQPPGPLEAWKTPPFLPVVRDGAIYGRGVGDNKGQLLAHICALAAWIDVFGTPPPFEIIFVFDGEEEIGSPASSSFISSHPHYFSGDFVYAADGDTLGVDGPVLFLGVRGLLYVELAVVGPSQEWHSGSYGGLLPNPVSRLSRAVLSIVDETGTVAIPRFHDSVCSPSQAHRQFVAQLPSAILDDPQLFGVSAFLSKSPLEAMFFAPQVSVCGLHGGYDGDGVKTSVPTHATAKLDFTLVPDQSPETVAGLLRTHLNGLGFTDIELRVLASCPPFETPHDHPFVDKVSRALRNVWRQHLTIVPSIGGGGPLAAFAELGMPCVMVPYGQSDLHQHSPDEHLSLKWFLHGIKASAELYYLLIPDTMRDPAPA